MRNSRPILLVEDDIEVLEFSEKVLSKNGYSVFKARCVKDALEIFKKEKSNFDLIFCDVVLPDKTGLQLVDEILIHDSSSPVILSSGYTDHKSQWPLIQQRGFRFIQKPYSVAELLKIVKDTLKMQ